MEVDILVSEVEGRLDALGSTTLQEMPCRLVFPYQMQQEGESHIHTYIHTYIHLQRAAERPLPGGRTSADTI